jgi:hypothetical protein
LIESAIKSDYAKPIKTLLAEFEVETAIPLGDDLTLVYLAH